MIDILTVTKRNGWVEATANCLNNQTLKDIRWIIVYEPNVKKVDTQGIDTLWVEAPKKTRHSNLNASLNEGLRVVKSEVVIFLQDFIEINKNTINTLLVDYLKTNAFITTATINPDGKHDARYTGTDSLREIEPKEWEANVAAAPMQAIYDLGGFDEEYDNGWSWDNVNLAERAELLGYKFYIDEAIKPKLKYHIKEPDADKTLELNYIRHEMTMRNIAIGNKPIKLNYV